MKWIDVKTDLPGYETPVFLKSATGTYVGFRESSNKDGETYIILEIPVRKKFGTDYDKITHWMPINMPSRDE